MQFLTRALFATAALATGAAICTNINTRDPRGVEQIFDKNATVLACAEYKVRRTGVEKFDTCPDCTFLDTPDTQFCESKEEHIGGNEFKGYCQAFGAEGSRAAS
ncbi:hypothetical protein HYALB_00014066 [Hymenoscyphus albidus]|uniref:Uncharacterized protein n=1 Tax=Hymenoscyphus albidus TaxID=595503 RepID=A0A9N9LW28_9HELO|nr:hypothetical protein HYALB_00007528 [Hymenoscyphus albidus]CAG8980913.1 hypothetical protein HYALB_00012793 [Hymenoscyphus albidus]CAG8982410.1 hypothetical protein HYALB_00014066 [Hymenoscyphus albidus]